MRLSRDVAGTFAQSRDSLQNDLTKLQRAFDQQEGTLATQQTQIDGILAQLANPPITIAPSGQVRGLPGDGLKVVAHDATLIGSGTPANPLRVLGGNLGLSSGPISSVTVIVTDAQMRTLSTGPLTVLAAPGANVVAVPLGWLIGAKVTGAFSLSPALSLQYVGGLSTQVPDGAITLTSVRQQLATSAFLGPTAGVTGVGRVNTGIRLISGGNCTGGSTASGFAFTLFYALVSVA